MILPRNICDTTTATPTSSTQNAQQARMPTRPSRRLGQVLPQDREPTRRLWCFAPYRLHLHRPGSLPRQDHLGLDPSPLLSRMPPQAVSRLPTRPCPPDIRSSTLNPRVRSRPRRSESTASWARRRRSLRHGSPLPAVLKARPALMVTGTMRQMEIARRRRPERVWRHPSLPGTSSASVRRLGAQRARSAGS